MRTVGWLVQIQRCTAYAVRLLLRFLIMLMADAQILFLPRAFFTARLKTSSQNHIEFLAMKLAD